MIKVNASKANRSERAVFIFIRNKDLQGLCPLCRRYYGSVVVFSKKTKFAK